jgi:hypothetical protein
MEFSNHTTSIAATTASNGTASSQAAPHRKNAAQRNRSDSPYQQRTARKTIPLNSSSSRPWITSSSRLRRARAKP